MRVPSVVTSAREWTAAGRSETYPASPEETTARSAAYRTSMGARRGSFRGSEAKWSQRMRSMPMAASATITTVTRLERISHDLGPRQAAEPQAAQGATSEGRPEQADDERRRPAPRN